MFFYDMSLRGTCSLYEYLYRCIRHDIAHGAIAAGEKLPSKRNLAKHLGISLITVEAAYQQLAAEGYIRSRERCGYYACDLAPAARVNDDVTVEHGTEGVAEASKNDNLHVSERSNAQFSSWESQNQPRTAETSSRKSADARRCALPAPSPANSGKQGATATEDAAPCTASPLLADFTHSTLATELFPYATWAKTVRKTLSDESATSLAEASTAAGSPQLRRAIAAHLRDFRGMDVQADQIVIGAGSQTLYQLVVQLLGRSRTYAVETPGYPLLARMYQQQNVTIRRIPLDNGGINITALEQSGATIAHIMPSHQFPTGIVTSAGRRRELLNWAREGDRYLIEDDYDAEFRMAGRPIPPLFSIDAAERVLYLNSFAKSLGAAFRMAYLVLPPRLAQQFHTQLGFYANTVSPLDQLALAHFIESGSYERHVNRLRTRARKTQDALVNALKAQFGSVISFEGLNNGLHLIAQLESPRSEQDLAAAALAQGVRIAPLSQFCDSVSEEGGTTESQFASSNQTSESGNFAGKTAGQSIDLHADQTNSPTHRPQFILRSDAIDAESAKAAANALARAWEQAPQLPSM